MCWVRLMVSLVRHTDAHRSSQSNGVTWRQQQNEGKTLSFLTATFTLRCSARPFFMWLVSPTCLQQCLANWRIMGREWGKWQWKIVSVSGSSLTLSTRIYSSTLHIVVLLSLVIITDVSWSWQLHSLQGYKKLVTKNSISHTVILGQVFVFLGKKWQVCKKQETKNAEQVRRQHQQKRANNN